MADGGAHAATEFDSIVADVESLEKIKFALVEMKENAGVDVATVDQSYKEYKDLFGKLKYNYLELDAKDRFLRELQNDAPLLPQEEVTALEAAVAARKQALSAAKERYDADRAEVQQLAESTTADYDAFAASFAEVRGLLADARQAEGSLAASGERPPRLLSLALDEAQAVLQEQTAFLREIDIELEARSARVEAATTAKATLEMEVVGLRAEHTALQAELERMAYEDVHRDRSLETNLAWLAEMTAIVQTLSGLAARVLGPGQIEVVFAPSAHGARPLRCILGLEKGSGRVVTCTVMDGGNVAVDDLVKRFCPADSAAVLVAEIQQRFSPGR